MYEIALTGVACLLVRLLLSAAAPVAQDAAGTIMCVTISALLSLTLRVPGRKTSWQELLPMLAAVLISVALQLLLCLGVIVQAALPTAFCVVCGLLIGAAFLFTGR